MEIVCCQSRGTVTDGIKHEVLIDARLARYYFRHDTEGAVGELFDAPQLGIITRKLRYSCHFCLCGGSECPLRAGDGNLIIRSSQIPACFRYSCNRPLLMRAEHIIPCAYCNGILRPSADNIALLLTLHRHNWFLRVHLPPSLSLVGHTDKVNCQFQCISPALRFYLVSTFLESVASHRPVILSQQWADTQHASASLVQVSVVMA